MRACASVHTETTDGSLQSSTVAKKGAEEAVRSGRVSTGRARGTDASRFVRGTTDARKLASLALYAYVRRRRTALVLSMVRAGRTIETHAFVVCTNDAGILPSRTIATGARV